MGKLVVVNVLKPKNTPNTNLLTQTRTAIRTRTDPYLDTNTKNCQNIAVLEKIQRNIIFKNEELEVSEELTELNNDILDGEKGPYHSLSASEDFGSLEMTDDELVEENQKAKKPGIAGGLAHVSEFVTGKAKNVSSYVKHTVMDWKKSIVNIFPAPASSLAPVVDYEDDELLSEDLESHRSKDDQEDKKEKSSNGKIFLKKIKKTFSKITNAWQGSKSNDTKDSETNSEGDTHGRRVSNSSTYTDPETPVSRRTSKILKKSRCCFCIPIKKPNLWNIVASGITQTLSSALVPGNTSEFTELTELNKVLLGISKDVDLRKLVKIRPLEPRHRTALEDLHNRLFPISYDPLFFDIATGCANIESSTCDFVPSFISSTYRDSHSEAFVGNKIAALGCFLPRKYLLFIREHRAYSIEEYLLYLDKLWDQDDNDVDEYQCDDPTYDLVNDEFMVGFATFLVNKETTNPLLSDDDYIWLETFYKYIIIPSNCNAAASGVANAEPFSPSNGTITSDMQKGTTLNWKLIDDTMYQMLYNNFYGNEEMLSYLKPFDISSAKTLYILSAGVTMGVRGRFLGTSLIIFCQVIAYFFYCGLYIHKGGYYKFPLMDYYMLGILDFEIKRLFKVLQGHYNAVSIPKESLALYYKYIIKLPQCDLELKCLDSQKMRHEHQESNRVNNANDLNDVEMPLALYLHVISYNESAARMYKQTHFLHITRVDNYYTIQGTKYRANILAHFLHYGSDVFEQC
ncbi:N-alpha-acetyltransferase 60-like [Babesia duncani]|uniref:histone acetyltransferase n=1 Tax=Babesia duncani TaxID=323732 RepID=A0AAD9UPB9_9APIC|nr:N-alpha-acetyltransferase 60-like [Babesia duncani]